MNDKWFICGRMILLLLNIYKVTNITEYEVIIKIICSSPIHTHQLVSASIFGTYNRFYTFCIFFCCGNTNVVKIISKLLVNYTHIN